MTIQKWNQCGGIQDVGIWSDLKWSGYSVCFIAAMSCSFLELNDFIASPLCREGKQGSTSKAGAIKWPWWTYAQANFNVSI